MTTLRPLGALLLAIFTLAVLPAAAPANVSSAIDDRLLDASDALDAATEAAEDEPDVVAVEFAVSQALAATAAARDLADGERRGRRATLLRRVATAADENVADFASSFFWNGPATAPAVIAAVGSAATLRAGIYDRLLRLAGKLRGAKRAKTLAAVGRIGSPQDLSSLAEADAHRDAGDPVRPAIAAQAAAIRGHLDSLLARLGPVRGNDAAVASIEAGLAELAEATLELTDDLDDFQVVLRLTRPPPEAKPRRRAER